jgi:WXG100 family type VII secretion target
VLHGSDEQRERTDMGVIVELNGSKWNTDEIRDCGQSAITAAKAIESELEELQAEYTRLSEAFTGLVATEQQDLFAQWKKETTELHQALQEIGQNLNVIAQNYEDVESANLGGR